MLSNSKKSKVAQDTTGKIPDMTCRQAERLFKKQNKRTCCTVDIKYYHLKPIPEQTTKPKVINKK